MERKMAYMQEQLRQLTLVVRNQRGDFPTPDRPEGEKEEGGAENNNEEPWSLRAPQQNEYNNDIKVDVLEYDGRLDADAFIDWLRTVERVFDYKQTPEEKKVKIVALKLTKYASTWWANICAKRERVGKDKVRTWQKMKKLLKEKFLPSYYVQENFAKFYHLKQEQQTVEEYSREFEAYMMKCNVLEDEPQTLVRFLGGLEARIANVVELHAYSTLEELVLLARKVDKQQKSRGKAETSRTFTRSTPVTTTTTAATKAETPFSAKNSPKPETTPITTTSTRAPRRCFRCQ